MPSTYTLNNGIELIGTGEQSGTWGDTTNLNLGLLDTALDGQVTVTLVSAGTSGSPNNLPILDGTSSSGRNRLIIFNDGTDLGALTFVQLTPNDAEKIIYIRNDLSGSRGMVLFQGTYNVSNDYVVPAGTTAVVYFDGAGSGAVAANVFNNAHFDAMNVVGNVTVGGNVTVTGTVDAGTVEFDNLSGTGGVTVTDILDQDNMASNSATALATQQSIKAYVDSQVTAQDLDFAGGTGTGSVDLDSQTFTVAGTANEIETSASGQTVTVGLPNAVTIASLTATTADINGGTIDGTTIATSDITVGSGKTLNVSGGTLTLADDQISGDKINGGTIGSVTITTADINGGTIDGTVIGATTPAAGSFTQANFGDANKAIFGAGSDLQIFHDGNNSIIDEVGLGNLYLRSSNLYMQNRDADPDELMISAIANGAVTLSHNGSPKIATTASGIDVTGTINAGDIISTGNLSSNKAAGYGAVEVGGPSGGLIDLKAPFSDDYDARIIYIAGSTLQITTLADEPILLRQGGSTKLNTTSTGVSVTGTVTADGLTVGGNAQFNTGAGGIAEFFHSSGLGGVKVTGAAGASTPSIYLSNDKTGTPFDIYTIVGNGSDDSLQFWSGGTAASGTLRFNAASNGDISFYEDTGTTAKFFWDASAESLGLTSAIAGAGGWNEALTLSGGYPALAFNETGTSKHSRIGNDGDGSLSFFVNGTSSAVGTNAAVIDTSGNVGIGTSSPILPLDLEGRAVISDGSPVDEGAAYTLQLQRAGSNVLKLAAGAAASNYISLGTTSDQLTTGLQVNNADGALRIRTGNSVAMRVDTSGNVLVGTTNSTVGSSNTDTGTSISGTGTIFVSKAGAVMSCNRNSTNGAAVVLRREGLSVGSIAVTTSATSYNTSSDYRLKTDAQPITGASARVQALNPVNFEWLSDGSRVDGFLAHEAQEVVPEAVTGTKDAMRDEEYAVTPAVYEDVVIPAVEAVAEVPAVYDDEGVLVSEIVPAVEAEAERTEQRLVTEAVMGTRSVPDYQGIDQSKLVPLLTSALQEALTKIDDLETRLTALEG